LHLLTHLLAHLLVTYSPNWIAVSRYRYLLWGITEISLLRTRLYAPISRKALPDMGRHLSVIIQQVWLSPFQPSTWSQLHAGLSCLNVTRHKSRQEKTTPYQQ